MHIKPSNTKVKIYIPDIIEDYRGCLSIPFDN